MTRSFTRFPIASRLLAVGLALAVVSALSAAAGAATSHQDVENATARVKDILGRVADARDQLSALQQELAATTAAVDDAEGRLEAITVDLVTTQQELAGAKERYRLTVARLNERAVQAFIEGPGQSFEFLVGATSLGELSDRLAYIDAVAQSDADLAQSVQNTKNELAAQEAHLVDLREEQRGLVAQARADRQAVADNFAQQQSLLDGIQADLTEAQRYRKRVSKEYQEALRAAAALGYGGGHSSVPIPSGFERVLQRCPVDGPRSFSDGFGAPRYAGGYHLHKGVDILSPSGTPIVAPFDGTAMSDYNALGGNVVFVSGQFGSVYNAHLSAFSSSSNGSVQAGDVIGYVGDTGDATGIPHDHFEFHPNVVPSGWPASSYGYSIIEDAVNPYPILVAACG